MQIEVAPQRILLLKDRLNPQQAKDIAWQKKLGSFDTFSTGVTPCTAFEGSSAPYAFE